MLTGAEFIRGNFVDAGDAGSHFFQIEKPDFMTPKFDGSSPLRVMSAVERVFTPSSGRRR